MFQIKVLLVFAEGVIKCTLCAATVSFSTNCLLFFLILQNFMWQLIILNLYYYPRITEIMHEKVSCRSVLEHFAKLKLVHTEWRQRQRQTPTWMGFVESNGECSHWGAATATAKQWWWKSLLNGLDTHLWRQRQPIWLHCILPLPSPLTPPPMWTLTTENKAAVAVDAPQCERALKVHNNVQFTHNYITRLFGL